MSRLDGLFVDDLASDAGETAPLVVLVHGAMDRHSSFARVRSRLMDRFHVVSYDRRGYAASRDAEPPATSLRDHVLDLEAVVAGRQSVLVGHSLGADIVLALAERRPDLVRSAVAYEPPLPWLEWWPRRWSESDVPFDGLDPREAAEVFLSRTLGRHRYDRLPLSTREEALRDGSALVTEMRALRDEPPPFEPAGVAVPVLLAQGSETAPHHLRAGGWLAATLPLASLHVIEGAGHGAHQSHPAELARLVASAVALGDDPDGARPPGRL